jgi:TolA-binding protein
MEDLPKLSKNADDSVVAEKEEHKTASTKKTAPAKDSPSTLDEDGEAYGSTAGASKGGGAAAPAPAQAAPIGGLGAPGDFGGKADVAKKPMAGPSPTATTTPPTTTATTASNYDEAMGAYKEARYAVAAKGFDASAAAGQKVSSSLLYAARSYRATGSCALALPRFQKVVASYPASPEAPHAALEGGQCAKATGDTTTARALFEKAKTYPATQKQAESELAALAQPPAASPPAKAKAAKPSTVDNGY